MHYKILLLKMGFGCDSDSVAEKKRSDGGEERTGEDRRRETVSEWCKVKFSPSLNISVESQWIVPDSRGISCSPCSNQYFVCYLWQHQLTSYHTTQAPGVSFITTTWAQSRAWNMCKPLPTEELRFIKTKLHTKTLTVDVMCADIWRVEKMMTQMK